MYHKYHVGTHDDGSVPVSKPQISRFDDPEADVWTEEFEEVYPAPCDGTTGMLNDAHTAHRPELVDPDNLG